MGGVKFLLILILLIPSQLPAAKKKADSLCAISIADAYVVHRAAKWIGTPFPEIRFPFFLTLLRESDVTLIREAKNLEMPDDPFAYLRDNQPGIQIISEQELRLAIGKKTLSFHRNVTDSEKNLVRESLREFSYRELGFLRVSFAEGRPYESDQIFEGPVDRIDINPAIVATCHNKIMDHVRFGNPVKRIELVHTHMLDPLVIHHPNGTRSPVFAYPHDVDNSDLVFLDYFRQWLRGQAYITEGGKSALYDLADLKKPAMRKKCPGLADALEKIKEWNAGDATLAITATIGTRIPSLFKFTYEE